MNTERPRSVREFEEAVDGDDPWPLDSFHVEDVARAARWYRARLEERQTGCIATKNVALKGRLTRVRRLVEKYVGHAPMRKRLLEEIDGANDGLDWKPGDELRAKREGTTE